MGKLSSEVKSNNNNSVSPWAGRGRDLRHTSSGDAFCPNVEVHLCKTSTTSHLHGHSLGIQTPRMSRDSKVHKGGAAQGVTKQWFQEHGSPEGQGGGGERRTKDKFKTMLSTMAVYLESQHSGG